MSKTEIAKIFDTFDLNGDGKVSESELGQLLKSLSTEPTRQPKTPQQTNFPPKKNHSNSSTMSSKNEIAKIFDTFDLNGDGKVSESELGQLLKSLSTEPTQGELNKMMKELDKDGDGYVDLEEFTAFYLKTGGFVGSSDELRDAFTMFDKDGNGLISARELHDVLSRLGDKSSLKECYKMIANVDVNGDGFVDFAEFKKMMANGLIK